MCQCKVQRGVFSCVERRKEEAARLVAGERAALDTLVRTHELDQRERDRKSERHQELKEMRGPIEALLSQLRDREDKTATLIRETEEQLREVVIASEEHERVMQQDRCAFQVCG